MCEILNSKQGFMQQQLVMEGFVQRSDPKNMPQLLDQTSDARENDRPFSISLFAELAQVHKQAIIPYIPRMMASIVRSLPSNADTQQLHQACAKAVASLARYTVDPTKPYDSNQQILFNLCSPLLPVLASTLESSAAGAAICLQALVESEKWKFSHPDLQCLICSKATSALEEQGANTVAFFHLVKSLAKFSRDASYSHVAKWFRIGLQVLQADSAKPGSWQQRLAATQLLNTILKSADVDQLGLDLHATTKILEVHLMDKITVVQVAVVEALETVKGVIHHELHVSSCESKRSDTEELGCSGSVSPRSGTSSHETVPSMAPSTVKFGMGPKRSRQWSKDSLSFSSHTSRSPSMPSMLKENTPVTLPRRVLSEIPALGKLSSNSEVLTSTCPRPLRRSSVDLGSQVGKLLSNLEVLPSSCPSKPLHRSSMDLAMNHSMQDKVMFASGKIIQYVHSQIHDSTMKSSSPVRKHVEGCQNFSDEGCTCSIYREEGGSNNQLSSTNHFSSKLDSEILEEHGDCIDEGVPGLPINSICRRACANDDCATVVPSSGCTDDVPLGKNTSMDHSIECLTDSEMGAHLKVEKPHVSGQEFAFRVPGSLLPSLQSSNSGKRTGESCKKCADSDFNLPKEANWMGSNIRSSGESEKSEVVSTDSEIRDESSAASCTSENFNSSGNKTFKSGSHICRRNFKKVNDSDSKHMSVELDDCKIHASGRDLLSSRDSLDRGIGDSKIVANRQSGNLRRSFNKSGVRKHYISQMKGNKKQASGSDSKSRVVGYSGKEKQICAGTCLGFALAVGVLVLAVMAIQHLNQLHDSHALVPT